MVLLTCFHVVGAHLVISRAIDLEPHFRLDAVQYNRYCLVLGGFCKGTINNVNIGLLCDNSETGKQAIRFNWGRTCRPRGQSVNCVSVCPLTWTLVRIDTLGSFELGRKGGFSHPWSAQHHDKMTIYWTMRWRGHVAHGTTWGQTVASGTTPPEGIAPIDDS